MKKRENCNSAQSQKRNQYSFFIDDERNIQISSNFQSGNIALIKQVNELYYILQALPDIENIQSKKSWFYFKINSQKGIKVRLIVQNVNIYEYIFQDRIYCKPMMKEGGSRSWVQAPEAFLTYRDQLSVVIDHTFKNNQDVYFCLTVPFTYAQNESYLEQIRQTIHPNISYQDEILTKTPNGNSIHMLTITEKALKNGQKQGQAAQDKKPIVFISARVHPGQVSSSFCLQGILQMLLDYRNLQSYLLRRLFIFKIVPMLNPDGVIAGNYRMDPQGFNLNRFYLEPNQQQHPAIYRVIQIIKQLGAKQKIEYYFDLHSHSAIKEAFIYGNALQDIVNQTYSQTFCKILQQNFPRFRYSLSNFDEQHMKHKDKGELLSKQGCGRVVINKLLGVTCSYTVQSSVFPSSYTNFLKKTAKWSPNNTAFFYNKNQYTFQFMTSQKLGKENQNIFVTQNKLLGKSLMVSILDMVNKNPFSRFKDNSKQSIIKQIGLKLLQNEDRFKLMDIKANQKIKMIHQYVKNKFQEPLNKEWKIAKIYEQINKASWPAYFKPIIQFQQAVNQKQAKATKIQMNRIRTQGKQKISVSNSLNKVKKHDKMPTSKKVELQFAQSHRSISPHQPIHAFFPQIKYSVQMKLKSKGSIDAKTGIVKQMNLNIEQQEIRRIKKKIIIDYINEEINKTTPDKLIMKKKDSSLNRLITNKIISKERNRQKQSQMNQYKNIMVQSRKRIVTQCKQQINEQEQSQVKLKDRADNQDQSFKGLELRKAEIIKKRFMLTNKAIQIIKKNDKSKIKLPQVSKINLIIQNSKKDKTTLQKDIIRSIQT